VQDDDVPVAKEQVNPNPPTIVKTTERWSSDGRIIIFFYVQCGWSHPTAAPVAEDLEWRQCWLECEDERIWWEEERQRCKEELHEMRQKESQQQEQLSMVFQMAITGWWHIGGQRNHPMIKMKNNI
jgi:hypothetical protein